ncbi:hypothetical protein [Hydrogenophaga sp.]|uniref:hypothetical protein n=1 Tax=Hydrogenophaga sp. TaxID=1904254 RepID=UPI003F6E50F5
MQHAWLLAALLASGLAYAQPAPLTCGEVVTLDAQPGTTLRYAWQPPTGTASPTTLVLLPGGDGYPRLDAQGCARRLKGNWLVRSLSLFQAAGFGTALVDAPTGWQGEDGLAGYRVDPRHAQDLGRVIADVRVRTRGAVWVMGTSRGAISAVNAASRLVGDAAPDGIVLSSSVVSGQVGARKPWVAHSVFDLPLENIRQHVLVVGHAADACIRSPASLMARITERTQGAREQVVTVTGGPGGAHLSSVDACEGRSPHGFLDQEAEVAAGIERFVRGARY